MTAVTCDESFGRIFQICDTGGAAKPSARHDHRNERLMIRKTFVDFASRLEPHAEKECFTQDITFACQKKLARNCDMAKVKLRFGNEKKPPSWEKCEKRGERGWFLHRYRYSLAMDRLVGQARAEYVP